MAGLSILPAFCLGFVLFCLGCRLKRKPGRDILAVMLRGMKNSLIVISVLLLISILTAMWRASGVIAYFVYFGTRFITPQLFLLVAFVLSCVISYALGTSVGVAGSAGIILITIARSGGVNELLAAGAILSGIYFGDRCSPASSAAILVSSLTGTELYGNVRRMLRTSILPLAICAILYGGLGWFYPLQQTDSAFLQAIAQDFQLSSWLLLPLLFMLVLPLIKVPVRYVSLISALSAFVLAMVLQGQSAWTLLKFCVTGYRAPQALLEGLWDGGGLISMLNLSGILLLAGTYAGLLELGGVLQTLHSFVERQLKRFGPTLTILVISFATCALFCSQSSASIMASLLLEKPYQHQGLSPERLALDLDNSLLLIASMVPWCLSSSVPRSLLGVGSGAIGFTFLIFLIPLLYFPFLQHFAPKATIPPD